MVSVSGTRRSASARHISATPSRVDRPYSTRKPCMTEAPALARTVRTRSIACATIASLSVPVSPAAAIQSRTAPASSLRIAARIDARIPDSRCGPWVMPKPPIPGCLLLDSPSRLRANGDSCSRYRRRDFPSASVRRNVRSPRSIDRHGYSTPIQTRSHRSRSVPTTLASASSAGFDAEPAEPGFLAVRGR